MTALQQTTQSQIVDMVRRIAVLEYALIEACNTVEAPTDYERAFLVTRLSTAQVHLFDLGTALRELGDESLSYSKCMRQALLETGSPDRIVERLGAAYMRVIARSSIPDGLRILLRANLADHRGLDVQSGHRTSWAA